MLYRMLRWLCFAIYLSPFLIIFLAASPVFKLLVSPIILFIILRGPLGPYTSRVTFCLRLRSMCRRAKLQCRFHHTYLGSFFRRHADFDIEIGDRRDTLYSIKFFPGNMNGKGIHLRDGKTAEIIRYLVIPQLGRRHAMGRVERVERGRTLSDYDMPLAARGESVMLFSPSPYSMSVLDRGKLIAVGNGEHYMGFLMYTARGFLDFSKRKLL